MIQSYSSYSFWVKCKYVFLSLPTYTEQINTTHFIQFAPDIQTQQLNQTSGCPQVHSGSVGELSLVVGSSSWEKKLYAA